MLKLLKKSAKYSRSSVVFLLALLAACTNHSLVTAPVASYAFSMLAPGTQGQTIIYARVVIDGLNASCPVFKGSDGSVMVTRLRPLNPALPVASETNFKVTVCEAIMAEGITYSDSVNGLVIQSVTLSAQTVQVFGDSGCKDCSGTQTSPEFDTLTSNASVLQKDLILHMGDSNYRGTSGPILENSDPNKSIYAYDAGDSLADPACSYTSSYASQNSQGSPRPDIWSNWQYDFFESAKELLPTAPWVFARGNHELCSRAGVGWFYFFGPGSALSGAGMKQMQCPDQGQWSEQKEGMAPGASGFIKMITPYRLSVGKAQLWVMDTANACDAYSGNELTGQYTDQYNSLAAEPGSDIWIMTHRPLWGYQKPSEVPASKMLQVALANSTKTALPSSVTLSLAGHMHTYESLSFLNNSDRPPQVVIGNSGVELSKHPKPDYFTNTVQVDNEAATGNTIGQYGYLSIQLGTNGAWTGVMNNTSKQVILNCDSSNLNPPNKSSICKVVN